jgi:glycosyltransferase involved in cell wall biosynthesis
MRVAIVHPSLDVKGGAENVVVWLAEELVRRGHAVTVFTSAYDEGYYGPRAGHQFRIIALDLGGYDIDPAKFIVAGWRLRNSLTGFDWVNPHNFPAYHWVHWARRFNPRIGPVVWFCEEPVRHFYPEVCNPHLLQLECRKPASRSRSRPLPFAARLRARLGRQKLNVARAMDLRVVPRLDRILANSEFIASQVRTIFRVPVQACLLGAPPAHRTSRTGHRSTLSAEPYLLTVSRLYPEKNIGAVLEAIEFLKTQGTLPFARYVIAGEGPLKNALAQRARDLGIADSVELLGFVSDDDLADLYQHAALVIYVPLDETYGLVFPEAAFWRKAVIGPDHGGPAEIIRHGETGLQVDATDPRAIADAIAMCMRDPELRARLGNAAYEYATAELTFSHFVDRFERCLRTPDPVGQSGQTQEPRTQRTANSAVDRK